MMFGDHHLSEDAEERNELFVVSFEMLLLLKALGMSDEKYFMGLRLIVKKLIENQTSKGLSYHNSTINHVRITYFHTGGHAPPRDGKGGRGLPLVKGGRTFH